MIRTIISAIALLSMIGGCKDSPNSSGSTATKKPRVVATTTFVGDLVRQIAGDRVDLQVIMPAGVDPHSFKPSTGDLGAISRADRVFFNGLHLEGKMVELLEHELKDR